MAKDSRTLKLELLAETKQFVQDMDKSKKEVDSFGDRAQKMGKMAAAAFAAAAAAAAAYAGKLLVDGVKAAIEDEAAQLRLANALKNVTNATDTQIASVEKQITALSLANGIADDQLRPAFQRLATATGSLSKASDTLTLALDISAATGKSVEAVSNALGKAYEGNTSSLARLGIGLSTAEIKSLGLDGTMKQLAETFKGAATVQANTLEGQIKRLQVTFDETKETVGAALLPTLQKLLDYFINTVIPNFIKFKDAAIAPVTRAIEDNKESLTTLYNFIKNYIIPIIVGGFGDALKFIGTIVGGILNVIGAVIDGIKSAIDFAINAINALINAYNKIPFLKDITPIRKPTGGGGGGGDETIIPTVRTPRVPIVKTPTVTGGGGGGGTVVVDATQDKKANTEAMEVLAEKIKETTPWMPGRTGTVAEFRAFEAGGTADLSIPIPGNFDVARARAGEAGVTIVVTAPSAIDEEGFKRAVVDALNESANRGTGGGGGLRDSAQIL